MKWQSGSFSSFCSAMPESGPHPRFIPRFVSFIKAYLKSGTACALIKLGPVRSPDDIRLSTYCTLQDTTVHSFKVA